MLVCGICETLLKRIAGLEDYITMNELRGQLFKNKKSCNNLKHKQSDPGMKWKPISSN